MRNTRKLNPVIPALFVGGLLAVLTLAGGAYAAKSSSAPAAPVARHSTELLHNTTPAQPAVKSSAHERTIWLLVTAYCPCKKCCGPEAKGLTASGKPVTFNHGRFVAADTRALPMGTKLIIPGYADGTPVQVIDRGGMIKGNHIDIFFPTHQQALNWGKKWIAVTVVE